MVDVMENLRRKLFPGQVFVNNKIGGVTYISLKNPIQICLKSYSAVPYYSVDPKTYDDATVGFEKRDSLKY